jgi:hypothetical protein
MKHGMNWQNLEGWQGLVFFGFSSLNAEIWVVGQFQTDPLPKYEGSTGPGFQDSLRGVGGSPNVMYLSHYRTSA